jgi:uncharacterized membrane protein YjgN (DUF898 family)
MDSQNRPSPQLLTAEELAARNALNEQLIADEAKVVAPVLEQHSLEQPINTQPATQVHRLRFTGSANEYFRIWIVNVFLTVITLGIYNAWAKVRTRRYFYAHTNLDGHPFEYHANPISILKGNLLIGGALLLNSVAQQFFPLLAPFLGLAMFIAFPYLIFLSLKFKAVNSSYRNLRFRFHGTKTESYVAYFWLALAAPFTLYLVVPYMMFKQKEYFFNNFSFGKSMFTFHGKVGRFYRVYLPAGLLIAVIGGIAFAIMLSGVTAARSGQFDQNAFMLRLIPTYGFMILAFTLIQQAIYALIMNYTWEQTYVSGKLRFKSSLKVGELVWLRFTNLLAIVLTLGLLTPWAKVRHAKYVLEHLTVISKGGLEDFAAAPTGEANSFGDAATDAFDIDLGL